MRVLVVCVLFFLASLILTEGYIPNDVYEKAQEIFGRVDHDLAKLSDKDKQDLFALGFTAADIDPNPVLSTNPNPEGAYEDWMLQHSLRFKQKLQKLHSSTSSSTASSTASSSTLQELHPPTAPAGYTGTGNRFFIKAFIPGPGCPDTGHLASAYVTIDPANICSSSPAPADGIVDSRVLPAPAVFVTTEWFRIDDRCTSSDPNASHRLGTLCEIFKAGNRYKIKCQGNAGVTRHWKRQGITSSGCWYIDCQKRDGFTGVFESGDFSESIVLRMPIQAGNPCVTASTTIAPIIMDFNIEAAIHGSSISLKLTGNKSRFPGMEGYFIPNGQPAVPWFYFDIAGRTVMSLTGGVAHTASVNWDARTFDCVGC